MSEQTARHLVVVLNMASPLPVLAISMVWTCPGYIEQGFLDTTNKKVVN